MEVFTFNELTAPPVSVDRRIICYNDDGIFCISDGYVYKYNINTDTWNSVNYSYHNDLLGVDKTGIRFNYSKANNGVHCKAHVIWLIANGMTLMLQKFNTSTLEVEDIYPVYYKMTGSHSYNNIANAISASVDGKLYITQNRSNLLVGVYCIDPAYLVFESQYSRYYIDFDNYNTGFDIYNYDRNKFIFNNVLESSSIEFTDQGYLWNTYVDEGFLVIWSSHGYGSLIEVTHDTSGYIVLYGDSSLYTKISKVTKSGDTTTSTELGYLDIALYNNYSNSYDNIAFVYNNILFISTVDNRFGWVEYAGTETILRLGHMGQIVKINGYSSGIYPFEHLGHRYWLKECQNGDANQSPLVIKHNGTIHYISK